MPPRVSAKTRQRRLARSSSAHRMKSDPLVTTVLQGAVPRTTQGMIVEIPVLKSISGSVTQSLTLSPTLLGWALQWVAAGFLLLILLVWTAPEPSSRQESSKLSQCARPPSLSVGGRSTSQEPSASSTSAELPTPKSKGNSNAFNQE